ncbi:hypothetical protein [Nocardia sp. AG03]|uniref:hypothetical protein n=1 Tax=Nocardia sp. AG03 TaxID=3025312 RepID=UPI0024188318|nr:hypothetical protein [Nocardia sp. AG03]
MGKFGWLVGLLVGLFFVLLGTVGYFTGIGNGDAVEITLAVGFFVFGTGVSLTTIWQLALGDRRNRRTFAPHPSRSVPPQPDRAPQPYTPPDHAQQPYPSTSQPEIAQHRYPSASPPDPVWQPYPATSQPDLVPQPYPPAPHEYPQRPEAASSRPQDAPVTPARPIPQAHYAPPPAPLGAATVAQTPDWVLRTRSAQHWLPSGIPYASAPTGALGAPVDLDRDSAATIPVRIREAVRETIAIEGPIERGVLVARVAQRFGVRAPSDKQQIRVLGEVPESLMRATSLGVFVWPSDLDPGSWRGFRFTPPTVSRPIETICAEEIVNAITHVAQRDRHSFDDIVWATLTQFGHDRTGAAEDRIEACLNLAVRRGRLACDADGRYRALV